MAVVRTALVLLGVIGLVAGAASVDTPTTIPAITTTRPTTTTSTTTALPHSNPATLPNSSTATLPHSSTATLPNSSTATLPHSATQLHLVPPRTVDQRKTKNQSVEAGGGGPAVDGGSDGGAKEGVWGDGEVGTEWKDQDDAWRGQEEVVRRSYRPNAANATSIKSIVALVNGRPRPVTDDLPDGGADVDEDDEYEDPTYSMYAEEYDQLYMDDLPHYEALPVAMAQTSNNRAFLRWDGTYIVNDDDGYGCILAYFKAEATIYYADTKGAYQRKTISPPDEGATVGGSCDESRSVSDMSVTWDSYTLAFRFGMDDLTDSWFVSRFSLTYDMADTDAFPSAAPVGGGSVVTVVSQADRKYWQTNNARSFRCLLLHDVPLNDAYNNSATLHFDEVRVQAFSSQDRFRTPKHCIHRVHRDEMVPVTVGATLAGSSLVTVMLYGIFRYFKVKKFTYDTME